MTHSYVTDLWMSRSFVNASLHIHARATFCLWHDSDIRVQWLICMCLDSIIRDVTHLWMSRFNSTHALHCSLRVTWLLYTSVCRQVKYDSSIRAITHSYVTWLTYGCLAVPLCTHRFQHVTMLIHTCAMTHPYVPWRIHMSSDSSICDVAKLWMPRYAHTQFSACGISHSYLWNMIYPYVPWLIHTWHDSFMKASLCLHACTAFCTWRDSFIRVK